MVLPIAKSLQHKQARGLKSSALDAYLRVIPVIEGLVKKNLLRISLRELYVEIDYRLHMEFMYDDKKYLAFLDKCLAYWVYERGRKGVKELPNLDHLDFIVYRNQDVYTLNGVEASLPQIIDADETQKIDYRVHSETLLVGNAKAVHGEQLDTLEYVPYEPEEKNDDKE